ncbi:Ankyrin repeat [Fusarium oxysporum f. sp. vasinfectum]|nr:Ankyrin repeat [Fusarium oxysporum f. sp. vasinfectum]
MDQSCRQIDTLAKDLSTAQLDKQQKAIIDWLSPLKPGLSHQLAKDAHHPGTSEWLQQSNVFQDWLLQKKGILWLSGPPGCGKTVLMSHAIESVASHASKQTNETAHAFVYCDFRNSDARNLVNILGSLLGQLCTQNGQFPKQLLNTYKSSTETGEFKGPTKETICEAIKQISAKRRTFLFIDGLDEADDSKSLAHHLLSLTRSTCWVVVLVTSRNEVGIQRVFSDIHHICLEHHVSEIDQDIERLMSSRLSGDAELGWLPSETQHLVSTSLLAKCTGSTIRDIKTSLQRLPAGLNETYGMMLARIAPCDVVLVRKFMTWLSFSGVPTTLHQLWEALAIEQGREDIDDESRLRSPQDILTLSNNLATVSSDGYVMLAHLSVRDYLLSSEIRNDTKTAKFALDPGICHKDLALDCLTYLLFRDLSTGPLSTQEGYLARLTALPLLQYATRFWFYHARNAELHEELQNLTFLFFSPEARNNFMSWVQVLNANSPFEWNLYPRHATSLYYAASLGLEQVVEELLQSAKIDDLDAPGSRFGGTAIHAAAIRGHITIIKRLVLAGADPGRADFNKFTPLHSAASYGNIEVIKVLLSCGAPTKARDGIEGNTPASWATFNGHTAAACLIEQYSQTQDDTVEGQRGSHSDQIKSSRGYSLK